MLFADVSLSFKVFLHLHQLYLRSIVGQTRLSSIAIINIERSYANCILQESIHRIIDIFGKRKNSESFVLETLEY